MNKFLLLSAPLLLATVVIAPALASVEYNAIPLACKNPTEYMDPVTYEIYKGCDDEYSPMPYPEPGYDYFNEDYTRVLIIMKDVETTIFSFSQDIAEMTDVEKRTAYDDLINSVSEYSDLGYSIKNLSTSYYTDSAEEKAMIKALAKQQKDLQKQVKKMKRIFTILSYEEFNTIDSVQQSFELLSENVAETKEMYTLVLPDLSEVEKKNAKKAFKMVDALYEKAKKQADTIENAVLALPEDKSPWTLQSKYNNAEYRVTRVLDQLLYIVLGS